MGKLLDNEIFKKRKYLQVLTIIFICLSLSFPIAFSGYFSDRLINFDRLTATERIKEIYKECLTSNLKVFMTTSGTEYIQNESARIFLRLLDGNSRPVSIASCNTTIYYPNNTKFINNLPMTLLEKGVYYYDFTTPQTLGNYITIFDCTTPSQPFIQNISLQGVYLSDYDSYNVYFGFDNTNNMTINNAYVEVMTHGTSSQSQLGVNFNGRYLGYISGANPPVANYTLTQSDFTLTDTQLLILTDESLGGNIYLDWTRLVVNYTWNDPTQQIRGQNEVHINNITDYTYFNQQFNQTWFNQQTIYTFIQNMNSTMVSFQELVKPQIQNISDYVGQMIERLIGNIIS